MKVELIKAMTSKLHAEVQADTLALGGLAAALQAAWPAAGPVIAENLQVAGYGGGEQGELPPLVTLVTPQSSSASLLRPAAAGAGEEV